MHKLELNSAAAAAKSLQSCPALCNPIDGSPLGSSVPGILQARILEWVAISFSTGWKWKVKVKLLSRLSNPMDCSPPGSSVHGTIQARVLEWAAITFSVEQYKESINSSSYLLRSCHRRLQGNERIPNKWCCDRWLSIWKNWNWISSFFHTQKSILPN